MSLRVSLAGQLKVEADGLGVVGAIVLALAGSGGASQEGQSTAWVSWVLCLVTGVKPLGDALGGLA